MTAVRSTYEEWLVESPLGRLKMQVNLPDSALAWPRTEKRAVSMLLQALPEKLKLEMVTSRKMSTHQIMFRLYCLFQPVWSGGKVKPVAFADGFQTGNKRRRSCSVHSSVD